MNSKIFNLLKENLQLAFNLPKYAKISIDEGTVIDKLPWTPARYRKFKDTIEGQLYLECDFSGTLIEITDKLDKKYLSKFFGEIWRPRTDEYSFTGWELVEEINKLNPKSVLDVGCGYHPFKDRIQNLTGIDPYNKAADYMVDVLEYKVKPESHDIIIALGSINFNTIDEIEARFAKCVELLSKNGRMYFRANPGIPHKTGPYVDIFPWSFEIVNQLAEKYNLKVLTFKKEDTNPVRLYFVYEKL